MRLQGLGCLGRGDGGWRGGGVTERDEYLGDIRLVGLKRYSLWLKAKTTLVAEWSVFTNAFCSSRFASSKLHSTDNWFVLYTELRTSLQTP